MLVTHTAQCALDNTAVLTFAFQGLPNWYWDFYFPFLKERRENKRNRICFYSCNSLEHHFSDWGREVSVLVDILGQKVFLGSGWD